MRYYPIKKVSDPGELPLTLTELLHQLDVQLDRANNCYRCATEPGYYLTIKHKRLTKEKAHLFALGEYRWCYDIDQAVVRVVLHVRSAEFPCPPDVYHTWHDNRYDTTAFPGDAAQLLKLLMGRAGFNVDAIIRIRKLRALIA